MTQRMRTIISLLLVLLGLIMLLIGFLDDQVAEMLIKSINICLECVGIG